MSLNTGTVGEMVGMDDCTGTEGEAVRMDDYTVIGEMLIIYDCSRRETFGEVGSMYHCTLTVGETVKMDDFRRDSKDG